MGSEPIGVSDAWRLSRAWPAELAGSEAPSRVDFESEVAPVSHEQPYPLYEPGRYTVWCEHACVYKDPQFRCWKALLRFRILPDGEKVWGFLNLGQGPKPKAGRRSRYWRAWVMANGSAPRKRQVLSARVFKRRIFEVEIGTVLKTQDGRNHPEGACYSTVQDIVRRLDP
jgi:hypothetical protein